MDADSPNQLGNIAGEVAGNGDLHRQALELCWEIEKLPASEQQTKVSIMASNLRSRMATPVVSGQAEPTTLELLKEARAQRDWLIKECGRIGVTVNVLIGAPLTEAYELSAPPSLPKAGETAL